MSTVHTWTCGRCMSANTGRVCTMCKCPITASIKAVVESPAPTTHAPSPQPVCMCPWVDLFRRIHARQEKFGGTLVRSLACIEMAKHVSAGGCPDPVSCAKAALGET